MTVGQLAELLSANIVNKADLDRQVVGGYVGDLLSFVMGRAPEGCAWFTVMTNVNVAAVAVLADVAVVVLCEGCQADETLKQRVQQQNVNLIATDKDIYTAVCTVCGHDCQV